MICENCGYVIGSFEKYWKYVKDNRDELNFCSEKCYDKGTQGVQDE